MAWYVPNKVADNDQRLVKLDNVRARDPVAAGSFRAATEVPQRNKRIVGQLL